MPGQLLDIHKYDPETERDYLLLYQIITFMFLTKTDVENESGKFDYEASANSQIILKLFL